MKLICHCDLDIPFPKMFDYSFRKYMGYQDIEQKSWQNIYVFYTYTEKIYVF